jgi:adenosylhomocysteine nucleosidase
LLALRACAVGWFLSRALVQSATTRNSLPIATEYDSLMYPCILFALRREAQPFYRHFRVRRRLAAPCPAWLCGTSLQRVLVLETGVGPERCSRALRWLTESYFSGQGLLQPLFLVSAGFAGALQEECKVGDVIVATDVVDQLGRRWPRDPEAGDTEREGASWWHGRILSTTHMVGDPREKQLLGERFGAVAVDMESAFVARFCAERGIPFSCARVISDDVRTQLSPQLVSLMSGPQVRLARVLASLARSPGLFLELWRLARDTRKAAGHLARALIHLLGSGDNPHASDARAPQRILLG